MSTKTGVAPVYRIEETGRVERVADGDDLVARSEVEAREDRHLRDRPVAHRDRVADADELRPAPFELRDAAAAGEHPAAQDLGDGGDLGVVDIGASDRDHAVDLGLPREGCRRPVVGVVPAA